MSESPPVVKDRIAFVDIGRSLAALLVFYSHVHTVWMRRDNGISSPVTDGLTWRWPDRCTSTSRTSARSASPSSS